MFFSSETKETSTYTKTRYCKSCGWYQNPDHVFFGPFCCPDCGEDYAKVAGLATTLTTRKYFLGFKYDEYRETTWEPKRK